MKILQLVVVVVLGCFCVAPKFQDGKDEGLSRRILEGDLTLSEIGRFKSAILVEGVGERTSKSAITWHSPSTPGDSIEVLKVHAFGAVTETFFLQGIENGCLKLEMRVKYAHKDRPVETTEARLLLVQQVDGKYSYYPPSLVERRIGFAFVQNKPVVGLLSVELLK